MCDRVLRWVFCPGWVPTWALSCRGSSHRRPWTRSSGLENNALLCFYSSFLNASVAHIFSSVSYKWLGSLEVWRYFCNQKYAVGAYLLFITISLRSNWFLDIFSLSRRFQEPMTTLSEDLFAGLEMQPPSYSTEASFPSSEETSRVLCPGRLHLGAGHTVKMYPAVHLRSMYFSCMYVILLRVYFKNEGLLLEFH